MNFHSRLDVCASPSFCRWTNGDSRTWYNLSGSHSKSGAECECAQACVLLMPGCPAMAGRASLSQPQSPPVFLSFGISQSYRIFLSSEKRRATNSLLCPLNKNNRKQGFPGSSVGKSLPASQCRRYSSIPDPGRSRLPRSSSAHVPQALSLRPRGCAPQQEKPPQ